MLVISTSVLGGRVLQVLLFLQISIVTMASEDSLNVQQDSQPADVRMDDVYLDDHGPIDLSMFIVLESRTATFKLKMSEIITNFATLNSNLLQFLPATGSPITPGVRASPNPQSSGPRVRTDMASLLKHMKNHQQGCGEHFFAKVDGLASVA